jgi:hypothetical protein
MNSKTSLMLEMATALVLDIVIIFASPLSATTVMGQSAGMTMSPPPSQLQEPSRIPAQGSCKALSQPSHRMLPHTGYDYRSHQSRYLMEFI